jgi:hypothetical protein
MIKVGADTGTILGRADNSTDEIGKVFYNFPEITRKVCDRFEPCALKVHDQNI